MEIGATATDLITLTCETGAPPPPPPATGARLVINEVDYDQASTDLAEFVEIYNATSAAASLANYKLILVDGAVNGPYG